MLEIVSRLALACVVITFAWASAAKFIGLANWRSALEPYALPRPARAGALVGVPLAELLVVGLIFAGQVAAGSALALGLLAIFCAALLRARSLQGDRVPCGCFGKSQERDYRFLLLRNALLAVATAVILVADNGSERAIELTSADLFPAALVLAGLTLIGWTAAQASAALKKK